MLQFSLSHYAEFTVRAYKRVIPFPFPFPFLFSDNDRFFPIAGYLDRDRGGGEKSPISFGGEEGEDPVPLARDKGRDYR